MTAFVQPPKLAPGDKIAVLSPSFAAPAVAPAMHEQALERLRDCTGLMPVEFPTTRRLDAVAEDRARDFNAALADPSIRGIIATIGGDDQVTVIRHLNAELLRNDPKPFLGFSDNTNILNWFWGHGIAAFHGGSTQLHLGAGPGLDPEHFASLTAALMHGGSLDIVEPQESEDYGRTWDDLRAMYEFGDREFTEEWIWSGPTDVVNGRTWGGCVEVLDQLALAGRMPSNSELSGAILLLELSENMSTPELVRSWIRALGERGLLSVVGGVIIARPPASRIREVRPDAEERATWRRALYDVIDEQIGLYNPVAVVCAGVSFGHTRPQWILPYGGEVTLDKRSRTLRAHY